MIYIGIDPGKRGAMAIMEYIGADKQRVTIVPFGEKEYVDSIEAISDCPCICCLERVHSMPKQGVKSTFNFGDNFGFCRGVLAMAHIPYELVTPEKWKREFQITGDKNSSITVCKRLFPYVSLRKSELCRTDHDGMAEALLMAEYARRRL